MLWKRNEVKGAKASPIIGLAENSESKRVGTKTMCTSRISVFLGPSALSGRLNLLLRGNQINMDATRVVLSVLRVLISDKE